MVAIDDTSDNLLTIDDACDGNNRWFLTIGSTGTRRSGLVTVRSRRNKGVANGNVAIRKPLGEDSPFRLFVITMMVTGCSVARNGESRGAFLFPGDQSTPLVNSADSDNLCRGIFGRCGVWRRGGDSLMNDCRSMNNSRCWVASKDSLLNTILDIFDVLLDLLNYLKRYLDEAMIDEFTVPVVGQGK
jgi:hypothetical protein